MAYKKRKNKKRKIKLFIRKLLGYLILLLFVLFIYLLSTYNNQIDTKNNEDIPQKIYKFIETKTSAKEKEKKYNDCLKEIIAEDENNEYNVQKQEIDQLIKNNNYRVSVLYEDLTTGFNYEYNSNKVYYGASLIKLVDAIYLINKASNNEIDLNTLLKYEPKYKMGYSSYMSKMSYGAEISLKDLIKYAISSSDNSAHLMLIDYIGFSNLKNYGQSLGAKVILTGGDNFGNQTAIDTNIYLKEAYKIINENEEYGPFLKAIMDNDDRNDFNTSEYRIYHKYGSNDYLYHDIGLSLDDNPYSISILTEHEYSNHKEIVQKIHSKIRELHNSFHKNRKNKCYEKIYN